ncbi:MAG: hypothetical protein IJM90_02970 [Firmicutes bacterium]|nr:hypothetical protein [Bacillota bacterium]
MSRVDSVIIRETIYVAVISLILSLLMQGVFLVIGQWNITVLWGNLLGLAAGICNFFLMALTVQHSVGLEEKDARTKVRFSMSARMMLLFAVAALGALLSCFNIAAVLIPLLFPGIAAKLRPLFNRWMEGGEIESEGTNECSGREL